MNKENSSINNSISEKELFEWMFVYGRPGGESQVLHHLNFLIKEYMKMKDDQK